MDLRHLVRTLQKERERTRKELERLEDTLAAIEKACARDMRLMGRKVQRNKRKPSVAARGRIAAAQRARWAAFRKAKGDKA